LEKNKAMRLAYVTSHFAPSTGGIERHVQRLAEGAAARAGWTVDVLTAASPRRAPAVESSERLTIRRFTPLFSSHRFPIPLGVLRHLRRTRGQYDLVHAHNLHSVVPLLAALASPPRFVVTPHYHGEGHSGLANLLHPAYRPMGAWALQQAQRVVCVSESEAALVRRDFPRLSSRIQTIPNGVDVASLQRAEPFPHAGEQLLVLGRLEAHKRVDLVIRAMSSLPAPYRLTVVGEGTQRAALQTLSQQLGVADRVTFAGAVSDNDVRRWLRTATITISMSANEAFGIVLHEALAAGSKVVASDIQAHREALESVDAQAARIVADASPIQVAQSVRELSGGPALNGSSRLHLPTWDDVANETFRMYEEVLRER
jgi:glycosyltransferase involved in cell wall biosynthesis